MIGAVALQFDHAKLHRLLPSETIKEPYPASYISIWEYPGTYGPAKLVMSKVEPNTFSEKEEFSMNIEASNWLSRIS